MRDKRFLAPNAFMLSVLCTVLCAIFFSTAAFAKPAPMVLVIDAGHGGNNSGAVGKFAKEKDVVLNVALKVGKLIDARLPEIKVVYTRKTDTLIALEDRGVIANTANADLFLSIHANGNPSNTPFGTETYVMGVDKSERNMDVALNENSAIIYEEGYEKKYEGYDPHSPESFILFSFMQNTYLDQSLMLATFVESEFEKRVNRRSRGVKQGPFLVLWKTTMPSVLVEIGFITNPEEEKYIASPKGQSELAEAIFYAVSEYKKRLDGKGVADANKRENDARRKNNTSGVAEKTDSKTKNLILPLKVTDNKITYHVQIFATTTPVEKNSSKFRGLQNTNCYKYKDTYRYYVGKESSLNDITPLLQEVKEKFPDAFVAKLQNNQPYR